MSLLRIALFGGLGVALGLLHFHGLRRDTRGYLAHGMRPSAVAAHAARLLATVIALVLIARGGAVPLLSALLGFLVARTIVVAQARSAP